jgi:hypothetical protein
MEKERLKYTINRLDHYYDSVNNKTAVYIGINTIITGSAIAITTQIQEVLELDFWLQFLMAAIIGLGLLSLMMLSWASIPYLDSKKKIESVYYFDTIAQMKRKDFYESSENLDKKGNLKDLRNQVFELSQGLRRKFLKLKWVGKLLIAQFIILALFTMLLIKTIY